jgi:hypothetical protein
MLGLSIAINILEYAYTVLTNNRFLYKRVFFLQESHFQYRFLTYITLAIFRAV